MSSEDKSQENKCSKYTEEQLRDLKKQAEEGQIKIRGIIEREEPHSPDSKATREHSS